MKAILFPLRFNELLDFVRCCHSALSDLSRLILPFNAPLAAWRFNSTSYQQSRLREVHTIRDSSAFNINLSLGEDSRSLFQCLSQTIQQESNARINRARKNLTKHPSSRMKAVLFALRLNELLDSALPLASIFR
jgi:hypothetical protein